MEIGFQGSELFVPAFEEISQGEEGEVVDFGAVGWADSFGFKGNRLQAGVADRPDQPLELRVVVVPEIGAGPFLQKVGERFRCGAAGEEDRDHRDAAFNALGQAEPRLFGLPVSKAGRSQKDSGGAHDLESVFNVRLPRLAEGQVFLVHPDPQSLTPHLGCDAADGVPVLVVVAEEDVESLGQGSLLIQVAPKFIRS
jgi:hypothetical protein